MATGCEVLRKGKENQMKLKKELGLIHVFAIASGAMISSGLFILPGLAHAQAGPAVVVSYLLAGLLAMTGMLSQAELVSAMPKAGGDYFYITRSMGPAVGSISGLITWFSLSLKSAFALLGIGYFAALVLNVDVHLVALGLCLLFVMINLAGVKGAAGTQIGLVAGLLLVLVFYVARGLPAIDVHNFAPFAPNGIGAVLSTAGFVFVSYGGLLKVASIAEEVKSPGRTLPLGMIFSLLVVTILYMLVVLVTTGVLGGKVLDASRTPISDGAGVFLGTGGKVALSIAAVLAFVSTANAGILAASRYPLALSRDGLLPESLGRISSRFQTPHIAILVTGVFMAGSLFLDLKILVEAASSVLIISYIFSCLSVIILRESRLMNYQPQFRAPLYPVLQIVGACGFALLLIEMGTDALITGGVVSACGLAVYFVYGRVRTSKEYALLHLIERITAKELTTRTLESELKEIIRERDEIIKDRFDRVIERSIVLDIDHTIEMDVFFKQVADLMADRLKVTPEALFDQLLQREKESSTAIAPGIAIPHIVIEGNHTFDILLARSKEGIHFSDSAPRVHAVFVLAGTQDERNFHLRALAAIAQIVQDPHFEKRWLEAETEEDLRDIILLGKRKRT